MAFLPHSHEWLSSYFIAPPWNPGEPGVAEWVGPVPRLSTEDADTSYADILATDDAYPSVTLAVTSPSLRGPLRGRVQIRVPSGVPTKFYLSVGYETSPDPGWDHTGLSFEDEFTVSGSDWQTFDINLTFYEDETWSDLRWLLEEWGPLGKMSAAVFPAAGAPPYQVSFIGLYAGGIPLRWRQRNDGLGGGSPAAARGVTSQQGSSRHRGYL